MRLFVERAHAAPPGFELTSENAGAVAEICRRLDGLPLAIELAAARVRLLSPQAMLARLDDRMSLLTGGARDLPERQRTLRNTLDWSFGLLSSAEQALFGRLGVFPGTFDLEAAEAVGGGTGGPVPAGQDGGGEIIDTLGSLVDASLVREADRAGQPRFSLLGTIRDYSRERLRESGQWKEAHDQHAAHFLAFAESAAARAGGSRPGGLAGPAGSRARQPRRRDVVVHGPGPARTSAPPGRSDLAVLVVARPRRGICPLRADDRRPGREAAAGPAWLRAERTRPHAHRQRQPGSGTGAFEQALALFRQLGDKLGIAISTGSLGHLTALRGEYARAATLLRESLALHQELGNSVSVALVYNFLGQIPLSQGDNDAAARLSARAWTPRAVFPTGFPS